MRIDSFKTYLSLTNFACLTTLSAIWLNIGNPVLAGPGHDHGSGAFQGGNEPSGQVEIDPQTAQRLGIKVERVQRQPLDIGIKTTGKIETLPSQKVAVTTPISGVKVVELLVEPGEKVKKGQPLAVLTSPELVNLRVESQEKLAQGKADLQQALADLKLAQQNLERFQTIAEAKIAQAQSQVAFAQEKYDKDQELAKEGALPRREALASETQLVQAKAELAEANSRRDVIEAENQLKRAQAAVNVAKEWIKLSDENYQTRLAQLGTIANEKGLVVITAPISGEVAQREVTIGQSFEDAGGQLMTLVNDTGVFATANIYEKDLNQIKIGQPVKVKVASGPERIFTGKIKRIGSVVEGETRVVPVQAQISNANGQLKPGMFAELEVITDKTNTAVLTVPSSAVVEAKGKKLIYIKNGNAFQSVEANFGRTTGNLIEVTDGLFEGDLVVTQRGLQLYAQSLRGGSPKSGDHDHGHEEEEHSHGEASTRIFSNFPVPMGLMAALGGIVVAGGGFALGSFWSSRRQQVTVNSSEDVDNQSMNSPQLVPQEMTQNSSFQPTPSSHSDR